MGYKKVDCPVCGNENPINTKFKYHRCLFCRRYMKTKVEKIGSKYRMVGMVENVDYKKEVAADTI